MVFQIKLVRPGQHENKGESREITAPTPRSAAAQIATELGGHLSKHRGVRIREQISYLIFKPTGERSVSLLAEVIVINAPEIRYRF